MAGTIERLDQKWYPGVGNNWDDEALRERVLEILQPDMTVLDLGAGAGIVAQMNFKGLAAHVCGVDLDPRVLENPHLDDAKVSDAGEIPYPSEMFDLVVSDNVMEHLAEPEKVLSEIARVLKPGGHLIFKTPNRWHYMPFIASLTPLAFHQYMNRKRGRKSEDNFRTMYRLNSERAVRRLGSASGFEVLDVTLIEVRPEYLRFSALTYFAGMVYQRIVAGTEWLKHFRIVLIAHLRKLH